MAAKKRQMDRKALMQRRALYLLLALALAALALGGAANVFTEYRWFEHLNFGSVYLTVLLAKAATGATFGLFALLVLLVHILAIKRFSRPRQDWTITTMDGDIDLKSFVTKASTPVVIAAAVLFSAAMGVWAARHWEDVLKLLNQTSFGAREAILNKDASFYLFELPALQFAQQWLVYLTALCAFFSAAVYFFRGAITTKGNWPVMSTQVRAHLLIALACVLATIGWGFRIEMFETLFSKRGIAYGATYTDVYANLNAYLALIVACGLCALFLVYLAFLEPKGRKQAYLFPAISIGAVGVIYGVGIFVIPTLVQQFIVNPNELERERPYLVHAIAGTRQAYDLNRIETKEFPATQDLKYEDLKRNQSTIDNVKIWDPRPLRDSYRQLQVIRLYYDFPNLSVDRYRINDRYWQVMLSAREMVHSQLPKQSQTWVNRHLQYTHGYGVCLSPVNQSVGEGLPNLWIKDIPPRSKHPELKIDRPEIYYGLATNDYALVKTTAQEFDYPRGEDNRYTTYQGEGGVGVGSFFMRLLFAIRLADVNLLFTSHLKEESRILFNRRIQQRVHTVAPFLMLDQHPYMVVANGRLFWVQDAYTISYRYPYSQPTQLARRQRVNYIRNSVKVVIDAYHGSMQFYVWDDHDPMIATYRKIFPGLFKSKGQMPLALREHVRYPKDLFTLQARVYESFHMTDPRVFYNQEDKWRISRELSSRTRGETTAGPSQPGVSMRAVTDPKSQQGSTMKPYYMVMRLPGKKDAEFLLMAPYTPTNKDNLVAWMTARCDGEGYGKLLVYNFPKQKLVYGPMQIEARIDQNDYISQWITLRNQQGSKVFRGDLLVIPIEDSILYVEPIYLEATEAQLPELKQVIVAYGDSPGDETQPSGRTQKRPLASPPTRSPRKPLRPHLTLPPTKKVIRVTP